MSFDADLVAALCSAASVLIGIVVAVLKPSGSRPAHDAEPSAEASRRNRKLVSLGWGVCGFLATATFLSVVCGIAKVDGPNSTMIWAIGAFLFVVLCVSTWVIS